MTKRPFILLAALIALLAVVLLLNRYTVDNKPLNNMQNNQQTSDNQTIMPQDNEPIKGDSVFPEPNQPPYYHVKIGDTIDLDSENYIKFLRVTGDSRCPSDLVCETSGRATVQIQILNKRIDTYRAVTEELEVIGVNRYPMSASPKGDLKTVLFRPKTITTIDGKKKFAVTLRDLQPYPETKFHTDFDQLAYIGLFHVESSN